MSVLADLVASLRASGVTAALVREDDDSGFAWAELGDNAASIDYAFDDDLGGWVARVSASGCIDVELRPTAGELYGLVCRGLGLPADARN